jgi:hypothetical protein
MGYLRAGKIAVFQRLRDACQRIIERLIGAGGQRNRWDGSFRLLPLRSERDWGREIGGLNGDGAGAQTC